MHVQETRRFLSRIVKIALLVSTAISIADLHPRPTKAAADQIVFTSERDGNRDLYIMDADGSNEHALTTNPDEDSEAAWSPDQELIAYSSRRDDVFNIYVIKPDGRGEKQITSDHGYF